MTSARAPRPAPPDPFRHLAVVHRSADELLDTIGPMLSGAVARGDLVRAAVDGHCRRSLERRLGIDAFRIVFEEPALSSGYSGQTTAAHRADRLRDVIGLRRAALILCATDPTAPDLWCAVDASCNLALAGLPVTLVCLYDAGTADDDTDRVLHWNHPKLLVSGESHPNPRFRSPDEVLASRPAPPAPALGPPSHTLPFANGTAALRGIRAWSKRHGLEAGLDPVRIDGLVVAVSELVSNSIEHGAGHGTLSWWTSPGRVVAEVRDPGRLGTTTPGLRRPDPLAARGRGVWLARQVTDVLHLWSGPDGTHARLEVGV